MEVESDGIKIRCCWHQDGGRPNLSVKRREDGRLSVHCFSCQAGGDVLHLIAALSGICDSWKSGTAAPHGVFPQVMKRAAELVGGAAAEPLPLARVGSDAEKKFPPSDEVRQLWEAAGDVLRDDTLCAQLLSRQIDPGAVRSLARALPQVGSFPRWARCRDDEVKEGKNWAQAGYRLVVPMYGHDGALVTLHARRFGVPDDHRKGTSPARGRIKGSVLANGPARELLRTGGPAPRDVLIVEGVPNWLVMCLAFPDQPVFGIIAGCWKGPEGEALAQRIPEGTRVVIWTDTDSTRRPDGTPIAGAGQKYAEAIAKTLPRRKVRIVRQPIAKGARKAPDANDVLIARGTAGLEEVLAEAIPWGSSGVGHEAEVPDAEALWERAAGLVGSPIESELQASGLDPARVEDRDLVRIVRGAPSVSTWNRDGLRTGFVPTTGEGFFADSLGLHLLRTGNVPPAGVLVTHGAMNFLVLATHWEDDDPNAPAIFAGGVPEVPDGTRVVLWPPMQELQYEHSRILASSPLQTVKVGGHKGMIAALDAAQPEILDRPVPRPPARAAKKQKFPLTDLGNAERLAHLYGADLRYVKDWDSFLVWDGRRWARDRSLEANRRAKATVRSLQQAAKQAEDPIHAKALRSWGLQSEASGKLSAMLSLVKAEPGIAALPEQLDGDRYMLNVRNGTLDLRTRQLLPHDRRMLITKLADVYYNPRAQCPVWLKFLARIFDNNAKLIEYVRRAIGYSLSGSNGEHVLFVLYGIGRNGKSTLLTVIHSLLGDYATVSAPELLMDRGRAGNQSPGAMSALADLQGARFVASAETEAGGKLDEAGVKRMVSEEVIKARFMAKDWFEFWVQFKVWLATNHKPQIRGKDPGIWEKIKLIPFTQVIPREERDRNLPAKLHAERAGILNWALAGFEEWMAGGLGSAPAVDDAGAAYQADMDVLRPFIDECCLVGDSYSTPIKHLRTAYELWCKETSNEPVGPKIFGQMLEERFPAGTTGASRFRKGLMLKNEWQGMIENRPPERTER